MIDTVHFVPDIINNMWVGAYIERGGIKKLRW